MGVGRGAGTPSLLWIQLSFFYEFKLFQEFCDCCSGFGCGSVIGQWEEIALYVACFAYSIIIVVAIIIPFVVLLNCISLKPQVQLKIASESKGTDMIQAN